MGFDNELSALRLMHLFEETSDNRPVYVSESADEKIIKQLVMITRINPRLIERIFVLKWNGETPDARPITEHSLFQQISDLLDAQGAGDFVNELRGFVYHKPNVGELFRGVVTHVSETIGFVKILPEIEGFLEESSFNSGLKLNKGDVVDVVVTESSESINGPMLRLSILKGCKATAEGARPLFDFAENSKLLTDSREKQY